MTNGSKGARESIRLLDTSARRGTIKQWDRGDRTDIKKETDESKGGGGKGRIRNELSRAQQHMYSPSFSGSKARCQNQSHRMTTRWRCRETHNAFLST